jgi:hypothetical protein
MNRYIVPAAVALLALCAPIASQAQTIGSTGPIPLQNYPQIGNITAAPTTYSDDGFPGSGYYQGEDVGYRPQDFGPRAGDFGPALVPVLAPVPMVSVPPAGMTWLQGHYNWDPTRQTYVWIEGQYVQAPHQNAQWSPGHWTQTPTAWIWVDGRWN